MTLASVLYRIWTGPHAVTTRPQGARDSFDRQSASQQDDHPLRDHPTAFLLKSTSLCPGAPSRHVHLLADASITGVTSKHTLEGAHGAVQHPTSAVQSPAPLSFPCCRCCRCQPIAAAMGDTATDGSGASSRPAVCTAGNNTDGRSGGGSCSCSFSPYGCTAVRAALCASEHFPVALLPGPLYEQHRDVSYGPPLLPGPGRPLVLPLNDPARPISVESALFSGQVYLFLPGLPSTPPGLFEGKKRRFVFVMQVCINRPISANHLLIGCHYRRPLNLKGRSMAMGAVLTWMSRQLSRSGGGGGGLELVLSGGEPRVRAPLAASANVLHVAEAGQQPHPLTAWEDSQLLVLGGTGGPRSGKGTERPWSTSRRRAHFRSAAARSAAVFQRGQVVTVVNWDQALGYADCRLRAGLSGGVDLVPYLGDMPLQLLVEDGGCGEVGLHLDVAHWRQLEGRGV